MKFYIYGEPVTIGSAVEAAAEEEARMIAAPVKVAKVIKNQTKVMMAKISNFETRFLREVRARHIRDQELVNKIAKEKISTSSHNQAAKYRAMPVFNVTGQIDENEHSFRGEISKTIKMAPDNAWRDDWGNVKDDTEDRVQRDGRVIIFGDFAYTSAKEKVVNRSMLSWRGNRRSVHGQLVVYLSGVWQVAAI